VHYERFNSRFRCPGTPALELPDPHNMRKRQDVFWDTHCSGVFYCNFVPDVLYLPAIIGRRAIVKNFILGHYFPQESRVHNLDARCKLLITIVMLVSLFSGSGWASIVGWAAFLAVAVWLARLPADLVLRSLRPFLWLFVFTTAWHILFGVHTTGPRISFWGFSFFLGNVWAAAYFASRMALFLLISAVLMLTTSSLELMDAVQKILRPLKRFGVPVHEIAMMASLALRFIPVVVDEAMRLQKAQLSRGVRFDGSLVRRTRALVPLILPLLFSTFKRSEELAVAMEARCYDSRAARSSWVAFHWQRPESLVLAAALTLFVMIEFV